MNKAELRKIYLTKQNSLSFDERLEKSRAVSGQFFQHFGLSKINFLHCFLPIQKFKEIDTSFIFERVWRDFPHIETVVPRINLKTLEMQSLTYKADTKLAQNAWQIHEPIHDRFVETKEIDAVLVPLLCSDESGFRVGYGKGFYDRFLRNCRAECLKIGLSYFAPVKGVADAEDFDVKLDFCITPEQVFNYPQINTNRKFSDS